MQQTGTLLPAEYYSMISLPMSLGAAYLLLFPTPPLSGKPQHTHAAATEKPHLP